MAQVYGLDIGRASVKGVAIERSLRQKKIVGAFVRPYDDPTRAAAEALLLLDEMGYDPDEDTLALVWPGRTVTARVVSMPVEGRRKILESLPYALETVTPFEAEQILADFLPRRKTEGAEGTQVAAIAALRQPFEEELARLIAAGVSPDVITPAPVLSARMGSANREAIIDLGAAGVSFTLLTAEGLSSYHSLEIDLPAADDESYARRIAGELKRLVYGRPDDEKPTTVRFIGGGATPARNAKIAALTGLAAANPLYPDAEGVEGGIEADGAIASALTVALMTAGDGTGVNFRSGRYEKKRSFAGVKSQGLVAVGLLALVLVMGLASFTLEGMRLGDQKAELDKQVRAAFMKALPGTKVVAEYQQLTAELTHLKERAALVGADGSAGDPALSRLRDISAAIPRAIVVDIERLVYEPGEIVLTGRTGGFDEVEAIKKALANIDWAEKVDVGDAKTRKTGEGGVSFRIDMEVAR